MLKVLLSTLWSLEHIGPETKWPPFCRGHFHMHFLQWKCLNFNYNFAEVCLQGPINNISALVQIMVWHKPSNKSLSEPIMTILPMHICITRPQYVELIVVTWLHQSHYTCHFFLKSLATQLFIVRRAGLLWSQQDFEWRWSVPLFKCLTVLEFSFILFHLCLLITFFNSIMNYVPIVTFWIFTYHKIWILSIMFCSIWSYWIIYFLACLEVSWRVVS